MQAIDRGWIVVAVLGLALAGCAGEPAKDGAAGRMQILGETKMANDEQFAFILEHLEQGDPEERAVAAWTLGELARPAARSPLLKALEQDKDPYVRLNACAALGSFEGDDVQAALIGALESDDPDMLAAALRSLAYPRYSAAAEAVGRIALGDNASLRELALSTLGELGGAGAVPVFARMAEDEDKDVRSVAAFNLGKLGTSEAVPAVSGLLDDVSWEVRANAAQALGMIGDPAARPALEARREDPNENVQAAVQRALDRVGN